MGTLIVLRHAKSDWSTGLPDRERPLAPRGRRQAPEAGAWLAGHLPGIDLAVVSPASRARQTWALVADCLPAPPPVRLEEDLYAGSARDVVAGLDAALSTVVVVGHNPDLEDLVTSLTGRSIALPTSALAVLDLPHGWADARGAAVRATGRPPA